MSSKSVLISPVDGFVGKDAIGVVTPVAETWAVRWVVMLVLVYAAAAVVTVRPIIDPDIWWHLRTGQWIVEHRTVPVADPFSAHGAGQPWIAYSWLFGLGIYALHELLGNGAIVLYSLIGALAITTSIFALVSRFEFRIARAIALTAVAIAAMGPVLMPRSYLFTVVFFIVEIYILFAARETGRTAQLWLLPPMFALWANLHIQFVYGLGVLGLATLEALSAQRALQNRIAPASIPLRPLVLTGLACGLATLATPYGVNIYRPVVDIGGQRLVYDLIIELAAPSFRQPANWVFLALALAATFSLGRQRSLPLFPTFLFAAGAYLSFATTRDTWFLVIVATAITAMTWGHRRRPRPRLPWRSAAGVVVGVVVAVLAVGTMRNLSPSNLDAELADTFPVAAVDVVRAGNYPGPLYNTFDWGGFLIWRLPQHPVSMDGRSNIHGDGRVWRSYLTSVGQKGWDADEELRSARLVILPAGLALTELLSRERAYDLVYKDRVAAVFTRREPDQMADDRRPPAR